MLDGTNATVCERTALRINPAKTCQPIGAMYAALGIHGCMPHSHGSQGCCAYHRSHLTRHFKEPVVATTSSFTEGASVFGGLSNMTTALSNIFSIYDPEVVAVHTTCLSEVIGDDLPMMIKKNIAEGKIPEGKHVIHANTPSFVGSHVTGFSTMVKNTIKYLSDKTGETSDSVNILPGYVDPSDMRELKRIAAELGVKITMLPDTSDVLDQPQTGVYTMYPRGGTKVSEIQAMGDAIATLACGDFASKEAAEELEKKCNVPFSLIDLPIGLKGTDTFIDTLRRMAAVPVPASITLERGRLLDLISDMSQYFHGKKVALFGDPDHVVGVTQLLVEIGMIPTVVITGTPGKRFERKVAEIVSKVSPDAHIEANADIHKLHQIIKNRKVDLLMGNTYGKHVARAEGNLPFVRFGFPIMDRTGHRLFPLVGYRGAMYYLDKILDQLFDKADREVPEELFELIQ
ncbi:MAG: nitrogenase molybdenum-iron protein subunit beta [Opitutales bacterium]|nr:nitrogenase molybdenum-iron protein subunit beta [Opitutales bacterium]